MCVQEEQKQNYLEEILESIPYKYTDQWDYFEPGASQEAFKLRDQWLKKGMYALVTWQWVKPFAKWIGNKKCLEVMAGRGWLSLALKSLGIDIIATDDYSWIRERNWDDPVTEVEELDAIEAVKKYGKDVDIIIMSWPYMDDVAYKVLHIMREINSNCIMVFIGEGCGGCTADDKFFETIQEIEDKEFEQTVINFKSWWAIHDYPQLVK